MSDERVVAAAERIIREGEESRARWQRDHDRAIFAAVEAGEALTVYGVRYVPGDPA